MNRRKGLLILLLAAVLCSLLIAAGALADISNVRLMEQDDGSLLVRWDDTGSGPYRVSYALPEWEMTYYTTSNTRYAYLRTLIPGQTYTIKVYPESASLSQARSYSYTVPYGVFTEYTIGRYLNLTKDSFSLRDLKNDPIATFEVRVSWPGLKRSREYSAKLCLKTPLGYSSTVDYWDSFKFDNKWKYTYMTYSMLNDWLKPLEDDFGMIPTGKYQFEFYVDNLMYGYSKFNVSR